MKVARRLSFFDRKFTGRFISPSLSVIDGVVVAAFAAVGVDFDARSHALQSSNDAEISRPQSAFCARLDTRHRLDTHALSLFLTF